MGKKQLYILRLVLTAVLSSVSFVLGRFFSFNVWNLSIGLSFVPVMLCGMLCGPLWGGACWALSDLIGALLFPFGPYFPGFTATAFLSGVLFGLATVGKDRGFKVFALKATALILVREIFCSLLLNSLWISLLYGTDYTAVVITRLPLSGVMLCLEAAFAFLIYKFLLFKVQKVMK